MTAEIERTPEDLIGALTDVAQTGPKQVRALARAAAQELSDLYNVIENAAATLEHAASLRSGQMDSQSRVDEVQKQVRLTLNNTAQALRLHPRPAPATPVTPFEAVI